MAPHRFNDIFTLSTPFRPSTTCTHRDQSRISPQWYRDPSHLAGLRALYARLRIAPRLERYVARALDAASSQTVVHLRLEQDWVNIANMCARTDAKRCWSPEDVAQKVNDTSAKVIIAADNTDRDIDLYHWSSAKFCSTWRDTVSVLVARGRAQVGVHAAKSDWSKRIRDFQYMDYDDYAAHH